MKFRVPRWPLLDRDREGTFPETVAERNDFKDKERDLKFSETNDSINQTMLLL